MDGWLFQVFRNMYVALSDQYKVKFQRHNDKNFLQ